MLLTIFSKRRHVAVKVYIRSDLMGSHIATELDVYKRIQNAPWRRPGRPAVRTLLDNFRIETPETQHDCVVHTALWDSVADFTGRNAVNLLPVPMVAFILKRVFYALDLLHNECHVAHTDIKESNILIGCDENVFAQFEQEELTDPSPRKELPERRIYLTRPLDLPSDFGGPILCDFGSAIALDDEIEHRENIQPKIYRAPEVVLDIPWTYSVDIWNVGCLVSGPLRKEA